MVGSRDNGEEIVQNAWLRLCARTDTTQIEHPRSYLFRACRNVFQTASGRFLVRSDVESSARHQWDASQSLSCESDRPSLGLMKAKRRGCSASGSVAANLLLRLAWAHSELTPKRCGEVFGTRITRQKTCA
ncbi:hypothetical protein [Brucella sp. NBRC 12953]|uniref:hypothetical protein n=1 Tax=Brucella sp. NBRC 12953 TaxID=3075481 RepID=UPI0033423979